MTETERNALVLSALPLANYIAGKYAHLHDVDDLRQEAALALIEETGRWPLRKGSYAGYAWYVVLNGIWNAHRRDACAGIYFPSDVFAVLRGIRSEKCRDLESFAAKHGVSPKTARMLAGAEWSTVSLFADTAGGLEDEDPSEFGNCLSHGGPISRDGAALAARVAEYKNHGATLIPFRRRRGKQWSKNRGRGRRLGPRAGVGAST